MVCIWVIYDLYIWFVYAQYMVGIWIIYGQYLDMVDISSGDANSLLFNMAIEIVDFPMNTGDLEKN